jgi:hypothetical protein
MARASWTRADILTDVDVILETKDVLSYAMAHNRVPVVDRLDLVSSGPARQDVRISLEVRDGQGIVTKPCDYLVDLGEQATTRLPQINLQLDPASMLQVEEQRPATITLTVSHDDVELARVQRDVQLLAARQWLSRPPILSLELLASFVMPNDPAVETILSDASAILEQRTGSPSIQGYQVGPERVDEIVQAAFEAMQARRIRYSEPPASWADEGQKVRTPTDASTAAAGPVWTRASCLPRSSNRPASARCSGWCRATRSSATGGPSSGWTPPSRPRPATW